MHVLSFLFSTSRVELFLMLFLTEFSVLLCCWPIVVDIRTIICNPVLLIDPNFASDVCASTESIVIIMAYS